MIKSRVQILCFLAILSFSLLAIVSCQKKENSKKPNVVYILTDQWRSTALGYNGNTDVKTPNLDKFAKEAVNFSNAVSVTPVCTPHRASLLTGRYPTTTGMFLNDLYLPDEELSMAEIFKSAGYDTGYLGKWHLDGHGRLNNVAPERRQGFDYWKALECSHAYNKMPYYDNEELEIKYWDEFSPFSLAKDANNYISEHAEEDKPFSLMVSIAAPHFPHHQAPQEYKDLYNAEELTLTPNVREDPDGSIRKELRGYYAQCTASDEAIGRILKKLKELDLWDNTIVVFSADHGEMMGAHGIRPYTKQLAWDESINVPFLIRYPSISKNKGMVIKAPINTPDILPSLLGLAEMEIPKSIEGEDISALMKSPDSDIDRVALVMNICPFTREYKYPEYRAIRTKKYTYSRVLEGADKLFDNEKDPFQMNNLVNNPEFASIQKELDEKLNVKLKNIGDEFKPRDYYLQKWNVKLDPNNNAINYNDFLKGNGVVQSPRVD
ncbi:MAG: arylsulfatase A-like enzyme [Arcticibacterium sp.]|jgi:arylsulfatase A-like enzyme